MNYPKLLLSSLCFLLLQCASLQATTFVVSSQLEFTQAHSDAGTNDTIRWTSGIFRDIYMDITKPNLSIVATTLGETVFTGASRVNISSDYVTLRGFQFVDGNIGTSNVINTTGSYNHFDQLNIRAYTCYKYLIVRESSQYVNITYCNFENRLNLADQNILSILVSASQPGYHKIQHCSFKNFAGTGNDLGIEPIRIGLSTQANRNSRSLVEYCYFTQCDGDGELISSKASQNVYRFNTFENNSKAELVLRHGSEAIVYGNFFLNGKGGVRVREGQNHYIYNNYFYELDDRAIFLQNEASDPLDNINIAFNTIVDCSEVILGGSGSNRPTNVTFSNNIFAAPDNELFESATGTETWIGNIAFGNLGITLPTTGITVTDPLLVQNSDGYFGLSAASPAIDAAVAGYALLPQFEGMEEIDVNVLYDLMNQPRPSNITAKDLGASEFPHTVSIQPIATEANTGPSYNTSTLNTTTASAQLVNTLFRFSPNPVSDNIRFSFELPQSAQLTVEIHDLLGRKVNTLINELVPAGAFTFTRNLNDLGAGTYMVTGRSTGKDGKVMLQTRLIIKR